MLVVITHPACSCSLVKAFVDVFGGEPQLAEALAEYLGWFEHRDGRRWPRGAWTEFGGSPGGSIWFDYFTKFIKRSEALLVKFSAWFFVNGEMVCGV